MPCQSDVYLSGVVHAGDDGGRLERPEGAVPLDDPDGLLAAHDGEQLTVGLDVDIAAVTDTEASVGVTRDGVHTRLVGEVCHYTVNPHSRYSSRIHFLRFDGGIWPSARGYETDPTPSPLGRLDGVPDRVRIDAAALTVERVLAPDPFDGPVEGVRFEFGPDDDHFRVTVPGAPLWPGHGWVEADPASKLAGLAKHVEALLRPDVDAPSSRGSLRVDHHEDTVALSWHILRQPPGVHPPEGVHVDADAFVRSWVRDARAYQAVHGDEAVADHLETVTALLDAAVGDRSLLTDPPDTDHLVEIAADDPLRRRDAVLALCQRGESAPDLAPLLSPDGSPADAWLLATCFERAGGPDAASALLSYYRWRQSTHGSHTEWVYDALAAQPPAVLASALLDRPVESVAAVTDDLLAVVYDESARQEQQLAIRALETTDDPVTDALLVALFRDLSPERRSELAAAIETRDEAFAERHRVDALADIVDPYRRALGHRVVVDPDSETVRTALDRRSVQLQALAIDAAAALDDPPVDQLERLLTVDRIPVAGEPDIAEKVVRTLETLDRREPPGPIAEPLVTMLDQRGSARRAAFDLLEDLAEQYEGGDFFGVDPAVALVRLEAADTDYHSGHRDRTAGIVTEIVDGAGVDVLDAVRDLDVRAYVASMLGREGDERAVPALLKLAADDDPDVRWKALRACQKLSEAIPPEKLDVDLAHNNRGLILYKRIARAANEAGDEARRDRALDAILSLTHHDDWHVRLKAVAMCFYFADVEAVQQRLETVATDDPNRVVRAAAAEFHGNRPGSEFLLELAETASDEMVCTWLGRLWTNPEMMTEDAALDRDSDDFPEAADTGVLDALGSRGSLDEFDDDAVDATADALVAAAGDADPQLRVASLYRLLRLRCQLVDDAVDALTDGARAAVETDDSRYVRDYAHFFLAIALHRRTFDELDRLVGETPAPDRKH